MVLSRPMPHLALKPNHLAERAGQFLSVRWYRAAERSDIVLNLFPRHFFLSSSGNFHHICAA
jgi:hypothetical protein